MVNDSGPQPLMSDETHKVLHSREPSPRTAEKGYSQNNTGHQEQSGDNPMTECSDNQSYRASEGRAGALKYTPTYNDPNGDTHEGANHFPDHHQCASRRATRGKEKWYCEYHRQKESSCRKLRLPKDRRLMEEVSVEPATNVVDWLHGEKG
ncbi:hypothetical protein Tco_0267118 [Tanacetum coccineum]